MDLQHRFTVPASVDTTWATFMELGEVAGCFPGATVTSYDGQRFEGTCKVKLGPIALMYTGTGSFVERDDATHHAVISANGKDKRGNGTAGATVTISLTDAGSTSTAVEVITDLNVTGKPAQFGRGVMQDVSDKLLGQFVACLEKRFAEAESASAPEPSAASEAPASAPASVPTSEPASNGSAPAAAAAAGSEAAPVVSPPAPATTPSAASAPAVPSAPGTRNVDRPAFAPAPSGNDDALDLGATVIPVLLRSYAPQLVAGVVGIAIGILIGRSARR